MIVKPCISFTQGFKALRAASEPFNYLVRVFDNFARENHVRREITRPPMTQFSQTPESFVGPDGIVIQFNGQVLGWVKVDMPEDVSILVFMEEGSMDACKINALGFQFLQTLDEAEAKIIEDLTREILS